MEYTFSYLFMSTNGLLLVSGTIVYYDLLEQEGDLRVIMFLLEECKA